MHKIAIVNSSSFGKYFPSHIERLKSLGKVEHFTFPANITGKDLAEALAEFDLIIASVTPFFTKEFFDHHPGCRLISRHGIGYNNIDIHSASEHKCLVTKVEGWVEQDAVAENAIALLMNLTRLQSPAQKAVLEGRWVDRAKFLGYQVRHKTVGVIGYGNIGSRVGEIMKNGFECRVLAYDPNLDLSQNSSCEATNLETIYNEANILFLNASLSPANRHMIDTQTIAKMKDGVIIVNTARGELVDDQAILKAVETGKVFAYGADVVEGEPIDATHPLLTHPNILITPHISAYTYECLEGMGNSCVEDCESVVRHEIPKRLINTELRFL